MVDYLITMAEPIPLHAHRGREAVDGQAPALRIYRTIHQGRRIPLEGLLDEKDCTRLILFNVQGFSTRQIWTELLASLGDMGRAIVKVKRVSGLNRNPHADMWVRNDLGAALLSNIRRQTKFRALGFHKLVTEEDRRLTQAFDTVNRRGIEERLAAVTHWRLALWQPWRERRYTPVEIQRRDEQLVHNLVNVATWNINGFWSKQQEIYDFVDTEKVAVLGLQETLAKRSHYIPKLQGYRCYASPAEEGFRGIAMFVDKRLASYEVPHGLKWLVHVKCFGYMGWQGPTHFFNIYLESGGNKRRARGDALKAVKGIVNRILERTSEARIVVMGDYNEEADKCMRHLEVGGGNVLNPVHFVGVSTSRFPRLGHMKRSLDYYLLNENAQRAFRGARVLREYNSSDHRPVLLRPQKRLPPYVVDKVKARFDSKMIALKGDTVVNDNSWTKLMDAASLNVDDLEPEELHANMASQFIESFDTVCRKHGIKKDQKAGSKPEFPRHLKALAAKVRRYSSKYSKCAGAGRIPEEIDVVRLSRAKSQFKRDKRKWEIRCKEKFYRQVVDDFVANDHRGVWNRLNAQLKPNAGGHSVNPVRSKDGDIQYRVEDILETMKAHYQDLLTFDPKGVSQNDVHWAGIDLGDPLPNLGVDGDLLWPEVLVAIRQSNRNTAPGKDGIHINVLKALVLEESMAEVSRLNESFQRPDGVRIDLPSKLLPTAPLTPLGKCFFDLLLRTWNTGCIPSQWNEVHIVNLYKGGDPENTNNYRGISLMSCAFKVLISVMATRLSERLTEADRLSREQAGFRRREEAVAQSIALAEIVRRRFLLGKASFGLFVDFQKAYDRLYHSFLYRVLEHHGISGRFLTLVKNMYGETRYSIRIGASTSASFSPARGAKQGDPMSPILYILCIDPILKAASARGGVRVMDVRRPCPGLMYADDVVSLESKIEDCQRTLDGIWDWGQTYGMDLGLPKSGVMMWPSDRQPVLRALRRTRTALLSDTDDSNASSVEGVVNWDVDSMDELRFRHDHYIYSVREGVIPTVKTYKYLGITVDTRLGDSRKVIAGERSMEHEFAVSQAKKGMKVLHSLRPFLTDRLCPVVLKVALVRNLVYSKMLYGGEFIGFQKLHAEPMQRVINTAAKWILGLSKDNHSCDAFTLCFELSLPPVHQELCAMRARLVAKLSARTDGGMQTWLQHLWDHPPSGGSRNMTWVSASKVWLRKVDKEKAKYNAMNPDDPDTLPEQAPWTSDPVAPIRPWAQLGRSFEMICRSNAYNSECMSIMREVFLGDSSEGGPREVDPDALREWVDWGNEPEDFVIRPVNGSFDAPWGYILERHEIDMGRNIPAGRTRWEVTQTNLVRDVVLEREMTSRRSKSWRLYDICNFGITRGFIREAANRPDLAEGTRWLSLARCRGFPTVEGAWQRIRRSGQNPAFERNKCPLCKSSIVIGWEWSHLLLECSFTPVRTARELYLRASISYIHGNLQGKGWFDRRDFVLDFQGLEGESHLLNSVVTVISIYLCGGLYRPLGLAIEMGWMDTYLIGFGACRLITPGFETYNFVYVAQFLQLVAPLYVSRLGGALYGDVVSDGTGSLSEGSQDEVVNQRYIQFHAARDSTASLSSEGEVEGLLAGVAGAD